MLSFWSWPPSSRGLVAQHFNSVSFLLTPSTEASFYTTSICLDIAKYLPKVLPIIPSCTSNLPSVLSFAWRMSYCEINLHKIIQALFFFLCLLPLILLILERISRWVQNSRPTVTLSQHIEATLLSGASTVVARSSDRLFTVPRYEILLFSLATFNIVSLS